VALLLFIHSPISSRLTGLLWRCLRLFTCSSRRRTQLQYVDVVRETFLPWAAGASVVMATGEEIMDVDAMVSLIGEHEVGSAHRSTYSRVRVLFFLTMTE
jgi:hypothetical protein